MNNLLNLILQKYKTFLFSFSALICLLFWFLLPPSYKVNESTDFLTFYEPVAENILYKFQLTDPDAGLTYRYPPGFPLILAFLFFIADLTTIDRPLIIYLFSVVCIGFSTIIIFEIARFFWEAKLALIPAITFATYPLLLWLIKQPNSETPFIVILFTAVLLLIHGLHQEKKYFYFFTAGILIGLAMLIRPIAIGVPFIISITIIIFFRDIKIFSRLFIAFLIILGSFITVLPWEIYVYNQEKKIIPLSISGGAGIYDGLTFNVNLKGYRVKKVLDPEIEALMVRINNKININSPIGLIMIHLQQEVMTNPHAVLKLIVLKMGRTWYGTDSQRNETSILLIQLFYLFLTFVAALLFVKTNRRDIKYILLFLAIIVYFWSMAIIALPITRYLVPVFPLLFIFLPALLKLKTKEVS